MKKYIAILLVLILLATFPICVCAEEMAAQPTPHTDDATFISLIQPREPAFTFNQLSPNSRKIITEGRVNQGETQFKITDASWYPSMSIEIGFEHQTTGTRYKVDFPQEEYNGTIDNVIITTANVPSGSYYVYLKNNGAMAIGSGTLWYEFTG